MTKVSCSTRCAAWDRSSVVVVIAMRGFDDPSPRSERALFSLLSRPPEIGQALRGAYSGTPRPRYACFYVVHAGSVYLSCVSGVLCRLSRRQTSLYEIGCGLNLISAAHLKRAPNSSTRLRQRCQLCLIEATRPQALHECVTVSPVPTANTNRARRGTGPMPR